LGEDQAAAVRAVARSGHGVDVIEALAGSGKTYTAGVLRQVYEDAGWAVVGVAPTGRAVRELAGEAGFNAATIDRALMELERFEGFGPRTVVVLDEAGMASTVQTNRLLAAAQAAGAKVIAIGDPGQLPSVQAGGWMAAAGQRLGVHRLIDVRRQRDPDERRALAHLHDGRPEPYLQWALGEQRLAVTEAPGTRRCGSGAPRSRNTASETLS
jgi:ATP-dependent exoDNAse (exonuclease V) alpha subunit